MKIVCIFTTVNFDILKVEDHFSHKNRDEGKVFPNTFRDGDWRSTPATRLPRPRLYYLSYI
jgi:hypothetical protein